MSGKWLHLIWRMVLVCLRVSLFRLVMNFLNGKFSPSWAIPSFLGEVFHCLSHSFLILVLKFCLIAEALVGRGHLSMGGRWIVVLERPSAACLARWLTFSLPWTSLWLDIQWIMRFLAMLFAADKRACIRY